MGIWLFYVTGFGFFGGADGFAGGCLAGPTANATTNATATTNAGILRFAPE
jgi:hypothetical protein